MQAVKNVLSKRPTEELEENLRLHQTGPAGRKLIPKILRERADKDKG